MSWIKNEIERKPRWYDYAAWIALPFVLAYVWFAH